MVGKTVAAIVLVALAATRADRVPFLDQLPAAVVTVDDDRDELIFELAPNDLPAGLTHEAMHGGHEGHGGHDQTGAGWPPVSRITLPVSGSLYGFRVELLDSAGTALPPGLLHHLNLIDPHRRELFLPISRRVIAAWKETGGQQLPWLVFGLPFRTGDEWVLSAMLHNPTDKAYQGVRTRLIVKYVKGSRPWPFFDVSPWQLDVLFPVGDKAFDLPPGRTVKSYQASPAIPGAVVALGGHVHERAVRISLTDVTADQLIWEGTPEVDSTTGLVTAVPVGRLYRWNRLGARVVPDHTYRVTVEYDNETGETIPQGGMGVIGGLMVPENPDAWPAADVTDTLYLADLRHYLRLPPDAAVPGEGAHHQHTH